MNEGAGRLHSRSVPGRQGAARGPKPKNLIHGPGKPAHIHRAIGRRPILAAGNSDGDIHMLKYAGGHSGLTLGLLVHHDDAARDYAYDDGAEKALRLAAKEAWVMVSMKDDWKRVF